MTVPATGPVYPRSAAPNQCNVNAQPCGQIVRSYDSQKNEGIMDITINGRQLRVWVNKDAGGHPVIHLPPGKSITNAELKTIAKLLAKGHMLRDRGNKEIAPGQFEPRTNPTDYDPRFEVIVVRSNPNDGFSPIIGGVVKWEKDNS